MHPRLPPPLPLRVHPLATLAPACTLALALRASAVPVSAGERRDPRQLLRIQQSEGDVPGEGRLPKEARGGSAAPCLLRPSSPSPLSRKCVGNRDTEPQRGAARRGAGGPSAPAGCTRQGAARTGGGRKGQGLRGTA